MNAATKKQKPMEEGGTVFDQELEDLPQELRWREWMGRIEAVLFASAKPVRACRVQLVSYPAALKKL